MQESSFQKEGIWLKGMLHSHSTISDGEFTAERLIQLYEEHGYDFLSITDHNIFLAHQDPPGKKILLLPGVEHDIEYSEYKCTHIVGIGKANQNETNYNCRKYSKNEMNDERLVDMMREDGQFVTLAHPFWSRMEPEEVYALEMCHAIEIYNNGTEHLCHAGNAELLWELMLRRGMHIWGTACDDVHTQEDLFGGWIWVKAIEKSKAAIINALHAGSFFASTGPVIHEFEIKKGRVSLFCSPCTAIHFVTFPIRGKSFFAERGITITEAEYKLTGNEDYIRAVCVDENGCTAWAQPFFLREC